MNDQINPRDGIDVTMHVALDTIVGEHYRQTGPDDYSTTPMTMGDAIIERTARMMLDRLITTDAYPSVRERAIKMMDAVVREKLEPIVDEVINGSVRRTNTYGEPHGEPVTLREVIVEAGRRELTRSKQNDYREKQTTVLDEVAKSAAAAAVKKELDEALTAAKAALFGDLKSSAAALMAESLTKALR